MNNEAVEMRMDRKGGIRVSAWALNRLGWLARERGDTTTARAWLEQSLSIYRELDDKLGISWTTLTLGRSPEYARGSQKRENNARRRSDSGPPAK